jgi:hypothetical protein
MILLGAMWERLYPLILSGIIGSIILLNGLKPNLQGFEKVLDGIITFSSIVVGFLGALLAVILSLSNTEVVKYVYSYTRDRTISKNKKIVFLSYCRQAIYFGFLCVLLSISMYLIKDKKVLTEFQELAFYSWVYISLIFIGCSVRIINLLMLILSKASKEQIKSNESNNLKKDSLTEQQKEELRKKVTKKIGNSN